MYVKILKMFFLKKNLLSNDLRIKKTSTVKGTIIPSTLVAIASEHIIEDIKAPL